MSGYPTGAANHPDAPYNEVRPRLEKVEATIMLDFKVYLPEGYSHEDLEDAAIAYLMNHGIPKPKFVDVEEA